MDNDDILEFLQKKRDETERQLARLNAAIAALSDVDGIIGSGNNGEPPRPMSGVIPPIADICRYLKEMGQPVHQSDLVRVVGELRQKRYPTLNGHYSNVWRALEYHVRHDRLICCVDPQSGQVTELKALPQRPRARKLPNAAELYQQENWFVLKEEVVEGRYLTSLKEGGFEIGQD